MTRSDSVFGLEFFRSALQDLKGSLRVHGFKFNNFEDIFVSDFVAFDKRISQLSSAVNRQMSYLAELRFSEQEVQTECDQLQERICALTGEREKLLALKERTVQGQHERLVKTKARCRLYEKMLNTKFRTDKDSITAFIFNPDGVIKHNMDKLRASANDSHELNSSDWTASELAEVDAVWCKLKLAEDWVELLDDSVQWNSSDFEDKNPSNRDRVALQSLRNLKIS